MLHVGLYIISVKIFLPCDFQDSGVPKIAPHLAPENEPYHPWRPSNIAPPRTHRVVKTLSNLEKVPNLEGSWETGKGSLETGRFRWTVFNCFHMEKGSNLENLSHLVGDLGVPKCLPGT